MKLKQYSEYKDSNIPWFGEIPKSWSCSPLFAVAQLKSIVNCPDRELLSVYLDLGVVKFSDVDKKRTNATSDDLTKYQAVDLGDFVLNNQQAWRGSVGVSKHKGIVSPAYLVLQLSDVLVPDYANYLMRDLGMVTQYVIASKGVGSIQRNLYWPYLKRAAVIYPSHKEQIQIASFLNAKEKRIRRFVRNKRRLIELLKEQKQAIINQAVTRGINPCAKMKPSGVDCVGDIPEHWDVVPLRNLGQFQNGISESAEYFGSGYPFISYGDVYSNMALPLEVDGLARSSDEERRRLSVEEGDVFFTRTSETIEEIGISSVCMESIKDAVFSGFIIRFRPTKKVLTKEFSKYYFRSYITREFFVKEMNIVTRASLAQDLLKRLPVLLPPSSEQKEIFDFLETTSMRIDLAIEKAHRQIGLVQEYRTRLISDVVTGEVDVRNIKVEDVADEELLDYLSDTEEPEEVSECIEEG